MKVLEFKVIDNTYDSDMHYKWWSRIYEYPLVLSLLKKYSADKNSKIHNTSWGSEKFGSVYLDNHVKFKNKLDNDYEDVLHTDLIMSKLDKTDTYDITTRPSDKYINYFDFVLNISTLEEVKNDHINSFNNLMSMLKENGHLIITFDLPGLQLEKFENLFNQKIKSVENPLNGTNSKFQNKGYSHLNCGYLVVKNTRE
jgi:hypothetical protein